MSQRHTRARRYRRHGDGPLTYICAGGSSIGHVGAAIMDAFGGQAA